MAIIGLSGKAQSGKDTVGKIIQYLTDIGKNHKSEHVPCFETWDKEYKDTTDWQIRKFASAVKDIVCILTGCTKEQLENIDFKNSYLGNEWNKDWIGGHKMTYRKLLQTVGTDLFRDRLHPDTWVNALFNHYDKYFLKGSITNGKTLHLGELHNLPNWIITDLRFPNEAKAVKDRNGFLIRINRDKDRAQKLINKSRRKPTKSSNYTEACNIPHDSETALDNYNFYYTIDNNGTIEELVDKVKDILIKEKII